MSTKRAYLVLAPESHGSHLVTDLLVHAGCRGGSGDHVAWRPDARRLGPGDAKPWESELPTDQQRWDREPPTDEDPVVWRRSVPHLGQWLDLQAMLRPLERAGYTVRAVVVTRDEHAAVHSQLKWRHVDSVARARENVQRAFVEIFAQLASSRVPFVVASYEALTRYPGARDRLLSELGLGPAPPGFEVWDGDDKWYSREAVSADEGAQGSAPPDGADRTGAAPLVDTGFPEAWFPVPDYVGPEYRKRVRLGREHMAASRIVFGGLARDVERQLPSALGRIARVGESLLDHRVVIYENDSRDGTAGQLARRAAQDARLDVISESLGTPAFGSDRSAERMAHLAACRNRVLDRALERHRDFDYLVMLDLDLPRGFSYEGLASCFGYGGWDWMGSNGISAPLVRDPAIPPFFYDAWAFRWPGDDEARPAAEINALRFHRGAPPFPVWSCFGGLAIYRMEALRSGARYGGGDCEHVVLHRALRERGRTGYLNPSLLVLYSDQ